MAISAANNKGVLTGASTQDTLVTGASTVEQVRITFRNYDASSRTLTIYVGGTTSTDVVFSFPLDAGESAVFTEQLASGTSVYAEASAATAISYFIEELANG